MPPQVTAKLTHWLYYCKMQCSSNSKEGFNEISNTSNLSRDDGKTNKELKYARGGCLKIYSYAQTKNDLKKEIKHVTFRDC